MVLLSSGALSCSSTPSGSAPEAPVVEVSKPKPEVAPERAVEIALGRYVTCAAMTSGRVRCWGDRDHFVPLAEVKQLSGLRHLVIAQDDGICGIDQTREVRCLDLRHKTVRAFRPHITDAVALAARGDLSDVCALRTTGEVSCWAFERPWDAPLPEPRVQAVPVAEPVDRLLVASSVCGQTRGGTHVCFERDLEGADATSYRAVPKPTWPTDATTLDGDLALSPTGEVHELDGGASWDLPPLDVVRSGRFVCGITRGERSVVCGALHEPHLNRYAGVLGLGHRDELPARKWGLVSLPAAVAQLELGSLHACARLVDGTVHCWGENELGQLGQPRRAASIRPVAIGLPAPVEQVVSDFEVSCAVVQGQRVFCWGHHTYDELTELDERANQVSISGGNTPFLCGHDGQRVWCQQDGKPSMSFQASGVVDVAVGWLHVCWRDGAGQVTCAGERGQSTDAMTTFGPEVAVGLKAERLVRVGGQICAETGPGAVSCVELGYDPAGPSFAVTQPEWLQGWSVLPSSASPSSCGVKEGGMTCFARARGGRTTNRIEGYAPTALATGPFHQCALLGGEVRCRGSSQDGQLGVWGTRDTFTVMPLPFSVDEVAVGRSHTCVRSRGRLYCLGSNKYGQMGGEPTSDVFPAPVRVELDAIEAP